MDAISTGSKRGTITPQKSFTCRSCQYGDHSSWNVEFFQVWPRGHILICHSTMSTELPKQWPVLQIQSQTKSPCTEINILPNKLLSGTNTEGKENAKTEGRKKSTSYFSLVSSKFLALDGQIITTAVLSITDYLTTVIALWLLNWNRLENEHLNNVGKYRAFKSVPLPFNFQG